MVNAPTTFDISLANYSGNYNIVGKVLDGGYTVFSGVLRGDSSIIHPSVTIENATLPTFNYAKIESFNRFYFIDNITSVGYKLWRLDMTIDVLETYATSILQSDVFLLRTSKQSLQSPYVADTKYPTAVTDSVKFRYFPNTVFDTNQGLDDTCLVLTVVGATDENEDTNANELGANVNRIGRGSLGSTHASLHWVFSVLGFNQLMGELQTDNFIEGIVNLVKQPMDNIISLHTYPFNFRTLFPNRFNTAVNISINTWQAGTTAYLSTTQLDDINFGSIYIPRYYGNFLDYAPYTKIEAYLPYIGYVELDNNEVLGQTVQLVYSLDLNSGRAIAQLRTNVESDTSSAVEFKTILTRECTLGVPLSIEGSSNERQTKAILSLGAKMAGTAMAAGAAGASAATASAVSVGTGVLGAVKNNIDTIPELAPQYIHKGEIGTSNLGMYAEQRAYVLITRRDKVATSTYFENGYNTYYGRPSYTYTNMSALSSGNDLVYVEIGGFTPRGGLSNIDKASAEEREMIENLLRSGVWLRFGT